MADGAKSARRGRRKFSYDCTDSCLTPDSLDGDSPAQRRKACPCCGSQLNEPIWPKRIILVRHGESEGNVDASTYDRVPDSMVRLTSRGRQQSEECGKQLRQMMETDGDPDWRVFFYVSPYLRTRQTLQGIRTAFEPVRTLGMREEPRLREQDFGNFQCQELMRQEKSLRKKFGRFFYRFPNGESAADLYDRITGFLHTLRRDIDFERYDVGATATGRKPNLNLVLVTHGITIRVLAMRWFHWTVSQFELLPNLKNCKYLVMQLGTDNRYSLAVHHSTEELRAMGFSSEMIQEQEWCAGKMGHNVPRPRFDIPYGVDSDELPLSAPEADALANGIAKYRQRTGCHTREQDLSLSKCKSREVWVVGAVYAVITTLTCVGIMSFGFRPRKIWTLGIAHSKIPLKTGCAP